MPSMDCRIRHSTRMSRSLLLLFAVLTGGCIHVKLEPVEVHATLDVNVKVDRALNDFFGDLDQKSATIEKSANQP